MERLDPTAEGWIYAIKARRIAWVRNIPQAAAPKAWKHGKAADVHAIRTDWKCPAEIHPGFIALYQRVREQEVQLLVLSPHLQPLTGAEIPTIDWNEIKQRETTLRIDEWMKFAGTLGTLLAHVHEDDRPQMLLAITRAHGGAIAQCAQSVAVQDLRSFGFAEQAERLQKGDR